MPTYEKNLNCVDFAQEWSQARCVVQNMLNRRNVSKREWQDLFTINNQIHSWVINGDKRLLAELEIEIEKHVLSTAKLIHVNTDENTLLRIYVSEWENYSVLSYHMPLPFNIIQRQIASHPYSATRKTEPKNTVRNLMLDRWNRIVFLSISDRLLNAAMALVEKERNGNLVDSRLIIGVRESFVHLNVNSENPLEKYVKYFEQSYLNGIDQFYKSRTAEVLNQNGALGYMTYANEKLVDEELRGKKYLDNSQTNSFLKLMEICVKVLVVEYQDQLLAESSALIINNEIKRLNMLYRLINRTSNGINVLLQIFSNHIKEEGLNAMRLNAEIILADSEKFVEQLLSMYKIFSNLVTNAFSNDSRFLTVRDQAFQEVVNNTDIFRLELNFLKNKNSRLISAESKCPELLANYCDLLLRKSALTKRYSFEEIDEKLNDVLLVLKYVANKDIFMRYHKAHLSRRLILELVVDQEKEENLVNKFREAGMPVDYVNKLFRMLQDIEINRDLNNLFKNSIGPNNNNRNMAGAWSRGKDRSHLTLPHELEEFLPEIEDFYRKQHSGRKLNWAHYWSTGTITFTNQIGKYDLEVTTYQMAVLFAWNDRPHEKISFESLKFATNLSDSELNRTLMSLVNHQKIKSQVLLTNHDFSSTSTPTSLFQKTFQNSTLFWINHQYSVIKNDWIQVRGKVNLIGRLQLNQVSGVDEEHSEIVQLRIYRIQEAIVKIMKMRKQLHQAQLQTELIGLLKHMFLPSKKLIKEQIEWLIEQNYLKRHSDDMTTFVYVN